MLLVCLAIVSKDQVFAQTSDCVFKPPFLVVHFGSGSVQDVNTASLGLYNRVSYPCPSDGNYSYTPYTSDCFRGDWHTLTEDHTPGDVNGNMLLVNSAYDEGVFFTTRLKGFKGGTTYQFGAWLMNVCRPSDKCPYPLLPNLLIRLQTPSGKIVAQFSTGEIPRVEAPYWTQHRAVFTTPPSETELTLTMLNTAPGGCGNDFAMDDISFRECVKPDPARVVEAKKMPSLVTAKKTSLLVKKEKEKPKVQALPKRANEVVVVKSERAYTAKDKPLPGPKAMTFVPAPPVLQQRTTTLAKQIEAGAGEVLLDLYDNGEIDGDTVSIYHNNTLVVSRQRLSQKPISFRIQINKDEPHHELVMVANNLGSIPPNTSLMMVTAGGKRYQVYISSTEQQNAKVVIDLKE